MHSPDNDIDEQVAAFRDELATATTLDTGQLSRDVQHLAESIMNAPTHALASSAIHDVHEAHEPDYARTVTVGALSAAATTALIRATSNNLDGPDGLLARLLQVSWTIRNLGITADSLTYFIPGEAR